MAEDITPTPIITSDLGALKLIKKTQFKRQIMPIILIVVLMIINLLYPMQAIGYMAIAAFGWYVYAKMFFRTKYKIAKPEPGCFVSPVEGKIKSIRKGEDTTLITIRKSWLDVVELRLPYTDMTSEFANVWSFHTTKGLVEVRIKTEKVTSFPAQNITGAITGIIPGNAIITIHLPSSIELNVQEKGLVYGGETVLFNLDVEEKQPEVPRQITVEEDIESTGI